MLKTKVRFKTLGDILDHLGGIPAYRVRANPWPGTATEKDVTRILDRENVPCELIDWIIVEKASGWLEAFLKPQLGFLVYSYIKRDDLGLMVGSTCPFRIKPKLLLSPDISFVSWAKLPDRMIPDVEIAEFVPDLAIEVVSKGNTRREMNRKLDEYFQAGVQLVWFVFPKKRTVRVYTSPDSSTLFAEGESLDGGDVLPGLKLPLVDIFARMPPPAKPKTKRRKPK